MNVYVGDKQKQVYKNKLTNEVFENRGDAEPMTDFTTERPTVPEDITISTKTDNGKKYKVTIKKDKYEKIISEKREEIDGGDVTHIQTKEIDGKKYKVTTVNGKETKKVEIPKEELTSGGYATLARMKDSDFVIDKIETSDEKFLATNFTNADNKLVEAQKIISDFVDKKNIQEVKFKTPNKINKYEGRDSEAHTETKIFTPRDDNNYFYKKIGNKFYKIAKEIAETKEKAKRDFALFEKHTNKINTQKAKIEKLKKDWNNKKSKGSYVEGVTSPIVKKNGFLEAQKNGEKSKSLRIETIYKNKIKGTFLVDKFMTSR